MNELINLAARLDRIAEHNGDEFRYTLEIKSNPARFCFVAEETSDGYCFVSGSGATISEAVNDAYAGIADACELWGYEDIQ